MTLWKVVSICLALVLVSNLKGQVVTSDPPFINADAPVTITFDASEGNAGLEDCNCDVYMHTGVITNLSTGLSDWKYVQGVWGQAIPALRMSKTGTNTYTFTMTPRTFYGVPANEEIEFLSFVFRNASGSLAGRANDGGDIYLEVLPPDGPLQLLVQRPAETTVIESGINTLDIKAFSSQEATFLITDNGQTVFTTSSAVSSLEYALPILRDGNVVHEVAITASTATESRTETIRYVVLPDTEIRNPAMDTRPGFTQMSSTSARLKLVAPGKTNIQVLSSNSGFEIGNNTQMIRSENGDFFWLDINLADNTRWFAYQYLIDGTIKVADPMSELVLDPWNDNAINNNYFPNYPSGAEGIVTIQEINKAPYNWNDQEYEAPTSPSLAIYELLMRDFLASNQYTDLIDTLDYIKRLGFNAIQLMPVQEFEGNDSWGYNPSFHKALDKYYGDPDDFKRLVDIAHQKGMAVILDVVYNHAFSQSPLCQMYWDQGAFRPSPDNPWLNVEARHAFNVGYDFNHESPYTRDWVKDICRYWIETYHIDGFRFDLSKGFTQRNTGSDVGAWSSYDASRIAILKDYADDIRTYAPEAFLILEHFGDNTEERELSDYGFMLWGNINHNYSQAAMGFDEGSGLAGGLHTVRGWSEPNLVAYMESHDEERLAFRTLNFGNSTADYDTRDFATAMDRLELVNTFFWTQPGPKMIWQFGEMGYDFSINRCTNGTINDNCRLSRKPIRWDYLQNPDRRDLVNHIISLNQLRQTLELWEVDNVKQLLTGDIKKMELRQGEDYVFVVGNFDVIERQTNLEFSVKGDWYEYFTASIVNNEAQNVTVTLAPGEYRIYTSRKLTSTDNVVVKDKPELIIYPNPVGDQLHLEAQSGNLPDWLTILDLRGSILMQLSLNQRSRDRINVSDLLPGTYIARCIYNDKAINLPFVKQ